MKNKDIKNMIKMIKDEITKTEKQSESAHEKLDMLESRIESLTYALDGLEDLLKPKRKSFNWMEDEQ